MPTAKKWSWEDIVVKPACKSNICHPNPESSFWKDRRSWLQPKLSTSLFQSSLKVRSHWKHLGLLVKPQWQMLIKLPVTTCGIEIRGRFPKWCHLLLWHGMSKAREVPGDLSAKDPAGIRTWDRGSSCPGPTSQTGTSTDRNLRQCQMQDDTFWMVMCPEKNLYWCVLMSLGVVFNKVLRVFDPPTQECEPRLQNSKQTDSLAPRVGTLLSQMEKQLCKSCQPWQQLPRGRRECPRWTVPCSNPAQKRGKRGITYCRNPPSPPEKTA